jgi:hypothetical protein
LAVSGGEVEMTITTVDDKKNPEREDKFNVMSCDVVECGGVQK